MKKITLLFSLLVLLAFKISAQAIYEDERYIKDNDPQLAEKLSEWQDMKFGLLMHWGAYSQWGIVESWSICPEDYGWCVREKGSDPKNYNTYLKEYEDLKKTFNPTKFAPEKWAKAAKDAGMKYMVFTTKHHDGFCMFDSKYTDYKVTDKDCAFSSNPKSNITLEIFDAFRDQGIWAGAYFSKPDWHVDSYWDKNFPPRDRNVNYDPVAYPKKWEEFVQFTQNQMMELLTDYGKVDILWLDGGWVAKKPEAIVHESSVRKAMESKSGYIKSATINQDIRMDEFVEKARKVQPGIIIVDRAVHSKNQNYLTPENRVPEKALPYPWESNIISGGGWAHTFDNICISGYEGVQMLVDIVSKGGNLLLNIAPTPEGEWKDLSYNLLKEYGKWMHVNSEAIYKTKVLAPYKEDNICMTQLDNGNSFFFYMTKEGETKMPSKIVVKSHCPVKDAKVTMLGYDKELKWKKVGKGFEVSIPSKLRKNPPSDYVWTIKVSQIER